MRKISLVLLALASYAGVYAQSQTADPDGIAQVSVLKKIDKKAKYGAHLIQKDISFGTAKGITGQPVVTAFEKGNVEMVAIENNAYVGYLVPYNQFVRLSDYDFEIFYKNKFKSQRYPPEKVSLTGDEIFFDDSYGQFYGFKAAESGQRARFIYNYEFTDAKYLTRVFFHEHIPIKQNSISFKVPSWLELDIIEKNFNGYKIKKDVKKDKAFTVYTYTAENLNGIKQEPSALSKPYYLPHLIITVRTYTVDQKKYNGFKTLNDMYAWYNFLYKKAENQPESIKSQVTQLTQGKSSDEEKIKSIYYWVQDNIRYIAFEEGYSGFVPQTVQEVYKNKFGDCKGMANLLTEMLKLAGYDAHFAWIGTREIPYDRTEIQSMCVDNHAISVLYFKGKTYFLDGTEKYAPFGKNAYRIQGKNVLIQNGDSCKTEVVPMPTVQENEISTKATLAVKGDKVAGHVSLTFNGEAKNFFHNIYNTIPANKRKEFLQSLVELSHNNTEVTSVKTSDFKNRDIPIVIEGDIEVSNRLTKVENLCYTSIDFFPGSITSFVPEEERQNPMDFDHVFVANDEVTLELPPNAKAKTLPPLFQNAFNNNKIEATYTASGNRITLKKKMEISSPVIYTTDFAAWKNFVSKLREFNRNNIVIEMK